MVPQLGDFASPILLAWYIFGGYLTSLLCRAIFPHVAVTQESGSKIQRPWYAARISLVIWLVKSMVIRNGDSRV